MEKESFRERNRRRREENAFLNLYAYAVDTGVADPKAAAERAAGRLHEDRPARPSASRAARGRSRPVPHRLDDRTKDQLYARAQELEIEGRSQMTKDELIDAIRSRQ
jgi:hypothetical protein